MTAKTILITGCSSGIGLAAAHGLRERGWRVFASCRAEDDCARLRDLGFDSPRIDYSDEATISAAVAHVLSETGGTLDALFNNGAYAIPGAVEDLPTDALRAIFEANFFGWHTLTRAVVPVMRAQGHGHIVQCSSVLGLIAMPWRGAYNATKFAVEALTDTMRVEMRDTAIKVVQIEPGPITTQFRVNAAKQFERWIDWQASPRADQYERKVRKRLYDTSGKPERFELPADAVVVKLVRALDSDNPAPHYYVTTPTYLMAAFRRILPARAIDWIVARV